MHQHYTCVRRRANLAHARVEAEARNVVHDPRPCFQRTLCHIGLYRVDRQDDVRQRRGDCFELGDDAPPFFGAADRHCALWTCRFSPDVDDVGALVVHPPRARHSGFHGKELTPVAEAVGGHVQDSHDKWVIEREPPTLCLPEVAGHCADVILRSVCDDGSALSREKVERA